MRGLRAHRRGGPEVLVLEDAPDPVIGDGQVLVAVQAAAITFDELTWDLSWETTDGRDRLPVIPAHEMAGVVIRRSPDVDTLEIGAEVFGLVPFDRDGAAAELLAIESSLIARKPRHATWAESASLALAGLTALQALVDHAGVTAGERVLVQGGAGGVGTMAVQLAVWLGADVSATASSPDVELVESLGAAEVFDRETDRVERGAAVRRGDRHRRRAYARRFLPAAATRRPSGHAQRAPGPGRRRPRRGDCHLLRRVTVPGPTGAARRPGRRGRDPSPDLGDLPPGRRGRRLFPAGLRPARQDRAARRVIEAAAPGATVVGRIHRWSRAGTQT